MHATGLAGAEGDEVWRMLVMETDHRMALRLTVRDDPVDLVHLEQRRVLDRVLARMPAVHGTVHVYRVTDSRDSIEVDAFEIAEPIFAGCLE